MKREMLAWLFFIICCNALSYSSCESAFNSKCEDCKPSTKEKQLKNINGMVIESNREGDKKAYEGVYEVLHLRNVQKGDRVIYQNKKGKGSYGGGDLLRPHHNVRGGECSLLQKSPFLLSSTLRHFAVALLILLFFS